MISQKGNSSELLCERPFLRITCLRFLSPCLSRDVHFPHGSQLQENQSLQLFPTFPPACPSLLFFSFRGHLSHTTSPIKIPSFSPFIFSFRGLLHSHISQSFPLIFSPPPYTSQTKCITKFGRFRPKPNPFRGKFQLVLA